MPVARPIDPLTPAWLVESLPAGERVGDRDAAERCRVEGAVLAAALQLGIAEVVTDIAVAYANERQQFDRPSARSRR